MMGKYTTRLMLTAATLCVPIHVNAAPLTTPPELNTPQAGDNQVVQQTTHLTTLTIPEGGTLSAPAGKLLTLTVNGVGTAIAPGRYIGDVVLTVTDDIPVKFHALPPHHYRTALYVDDGAVVPNKSVMAAAQGGPVTNASADNLTIRSNEPRFNGVVVTGNSHYTINNPRISLIGNGGNDFAGFGAGIMSSGTADVTVNHASIVNHGAIRTAIFVGGHSTMHVNDSEILTFNGTLPSDYHFTVEVGKMMEVPWMLGLKGNVRATNLVDYGTVYYTNSHIRTQGWGALSTDDSAHVRMYVKHCLVETVESGYGAYSIGDSIDTFSDSKLNVADIGLIMAGPGSGTFTDGTVVNSGRFGVMMHSGQGGGLLTINKHSVFNTKSTAIQIKGRGSNILIDDAQIHAGNGIILEAMENDDPFMKHMMAGGPPPGGAPGGPAPAGGPGAVVGIQDGPPPPGPDEMPHIIGTFRNVALVGDMIDARTNQGDMTLKFEHASITGALTTGIATPAQGKEPTAETYYLIGDMTNAYQPVQGKYGLSVSIDGTSRWTVNKSSYLTELALAKGAVVAAPAGHHVVLTVNGVRKPLRAGVYKGQVSLTVG